jgi:xylan 1,4-beta-xylosidase
MMAGPVCYYNGLKFTILHFCHRGRREVSAGHVRLPDQPSGDVYKLIQCVASRQLCQLITNGFVSVIELRAETDLVPEQFDASILSDEATAPGLPNFTGAFVGMCCQDLAGTARPADFDYFEYEEREYRPVV